MNLSAPGPCGVRLHLAAKGLDRKDAGGFGKSDPFIIFYNDNGQVLTKDGPRPKTLFKTEIIQNTCDPVWEPFVLYYDECGGPGAKLILECFDYDEDDNLDLIGELRTSFTELLKKPTNLLFKHPRKKGPFYRHSGHLVIQSATEIQSNQRDPKSLPAPGYTITFSGKSLERKDLLSSDPFLKIFALKQPEPVQVGFGLPAPPVKAKKASKPKYAMIAKTEVIKSNLNPKWNPVRLDVAECGGMDAKIRIECWDYDSNLSHDFIAQCWTTLREMLWSKPMWNLINPSKVGNVAYRNSGTLHVTSIKLETSAKPVHSAFKLLFKASNLDRKDINGKSDPYLVVKGCPKPQWSYPYCPDPQREAMARGKKKKGLEAKAVQVYRSEVIQKNLNPIWLEFQINAYDVGGLDSVLNFEVYDWDQRGSDELIGICSSTLRELSMPGASFPLKNKNNILQALSGYLILDKITPTTPKLTNAPYAFKVKLRAEKVERKDLGGLGASDPFLVLNARPYGQPKDVPVHKTEVVRTTTSPTWNEFTMEIAKFGGLDSHIKIECWDHDDGKKPDFIGGAVTTIRELLNFKETPKLKLINPSKKGRLGYTDSGILIFDTFTPIDPPANYVATTNFTGVDFKPPAGFTGFDTVALNSRVGTPAVGSPAIPGAASHPGASGFAPPAGGFAPPPGQAAPYGTQAPPYGQPPYGYGAPAAAPYGTQAPPYGQPPYGYPPYGTQQPAYGQPPYGYPPYGTQAPAQPPAPGQPPAGADAQAQPPAPGQPPAGYGAQGWGAPPGQQGWGAPPPGYGAPPGQQGWGAPPAGYGAPPGQQGWGAPPPGYGAPPGQQGWGAPPAGYGAPPPGQAGQ